jgi:hypothetical protein
MGLSRCVRLYRELYKLRVVTANAELCLAGEQDYLARPSSRWKAFDRQLNDWTITDTNIYLL